MAAPAALTSLLLRAGLSVGAATRTAAAFAATGKVGTAFARTIGWSTSVNLGMAASTPLTRAFQYRTNRFDPNLSPEAEVLTGLWYAGRINAADMKTSMHNLGIDFRPGEAAGDLLQQIWTDAVDLAQPLFGLDDYLKWKRQKRVTTERFDDVLDRLGFKGHPDRTLYADDWEATPLDVIQAGFLLQTLTDEDVRRLLQEHGWGDVQIGNILGTWRAYLSPADALTLWMRRMYKDDDLTASLRASGLVDSGMQEDFKKLANGLPGAGDIINLNQRRAWDNELAAQFGLDEGKTAAYTEFMRQIGMGGPADPLDDTGNPAGNNKWSDLLWRASRLIPSPGQALEMYRRLRPKEAAKLAAEYPGLKPFELGDFVQILGLHGVGSIAAIQLAAIARAPLRWFDIRNGWNLGVLDDEGASEALQNRGIAPEQVQVHLGIFKGLKDKKIQDRIDNRVRRLLNNHANRVLAQYRLGILDSDTAKNSLRGDDWDEDSIVIALATVDLEEQEKLVEAVVKRAKSDFFNGRATQAELKGRLKAAGIADDAATRYLQRWAMERGEYNIVMSTEKNLDMFKRGLLTLPQLTQRLSNLGWSGVDELLYVTAALQDVFKATAKALAAAQAQKEKAAKELERVIKEQQNAILRHQAQLRLWTPISTMKKWIKSGEIDDGSFFARLASMGYPLSTAKLYYEEATGNAAPSAADSTYAAAQGADQT